MEEMMQLLFDREAIRDLASRFAAYEDRHMWDSAADCFTDDGVFDETAVGGPRLSGKEQIRTFFKDEIATSMTFQAHHLSGHLVTQQGEKEAKGFCNIFFEGGFKDGSAVKVHAYLDDVYARVDGKWLYKSHTVVLLGPRQFWTPVTELPTQSA